MAKKKRTYNTRLIKQDYSYRYYEIASLFGIHPNVIPRWVQDGLLRIDDQKPYMIHGADLARYLDARQKKRKKPCKAGELFCCKCHSPRLVWEGAVDITIRNEKTLYISGVCIVCDSTINQIGSMAKIPKYQETFNVLTIDPPDIIDSGNTSVKCEWRKE